MADPPPARPRRLPTRYGYPIVVATAVPAVGLLTIWLFSLPSPDRAEWAGVFSFVLGAFGFLATLLQLHPPRNGGERDGQPEPPPPPPPWLRARWIALAAVGIVAVLVASWYWFLIHKPHTRVTDQITLSREAHRFQRGATARLGIPGSPPSRHRLSLTLRLDNPSGQGDCVVPAKLAVVLITDGRRLPQGTVRSGEELRLNLGEVAHSARVEVTLSVPERTCALRLQVEEAILYNTWLEA
jgi:hypothetical protein